MENACPGLYFSVISKKILELDSVTVLPAWYDGSYCSGLEEDAKSFPYYPLKEEKTGVNIYIGG